MNPLHGQRQQSPGGNLYNYGGQHDDFSTHFTDPNSSFSDPNTLFNQNFNQGFQSDFQSSADSVSDQSFPNPINGHGQYGSIVPMQTDPSAWQNNPYLESNPYSYANTVNQPSAFSSNPYGQRLNPYGSEVNMNFSFPNRDFNDGAVNQPAPTISPAVIDQSEQTIPPSALQTAEDIWQGTTVPPQSVDSSRMQPEKRAIAPELQPRPQNYQSPVPTHSLAPVVPSAPSKPMHNYDELQDGVPAVVTQEGFHFREVSEYSGSAEAILQKGWIFLTKETFETNESRLASLPEAPTRASISQLRIKLSQSEAAKEHPSAKAKLEEKLRRREKKDKGKKKKDRTVAPKTTSVAKAASVAGHGPRQNVEESDSEDYTDSSEDETGSDYEGESDREDEKAPLPETKPTDHVGAIKYEVIEAVWAPSAKRLTSDLLKVRFGSWLESLQKVRKEWKTATDSTEKTTKKQLFEDLIKLTTQHGHYNFIESIDQLPPLANIIAACVTEAVKAEKYDDSLLQAIVLLLLKISVIKWSFIIGTRLNKLAPRITKNAKGSLKTAAGLLVEKINKSEKATKEAEKKPSESNPAPVKTETPLDTKAISSLSKEKPPADTKKSILAAADIKRTASSSPDSKKPSLIATQKKPVTSLGSKLATSGASKSTTVVKTSSADGAPGKVTTPAASSLVSKEKERTRYVVTKPPSIFSSISASKRSASAVNTAKPPVKEQKLVKPETKSPPAPPPQPAAVPARPVFSFSETLASIGKPKEEDKSKQNAVDDQPPETEEERKKRLRKESRRHLRVSWPADDKLCQIKLFDHGLEDQIHHEAAEVADLKDEGRAFKREYRQQHGNVDDFEQDFIKESDDVLDPEPTDFSNIEQSQLARNTTSCANGSKEIESPEAEEQKKRENGVMIAIYATEQDIPYSPREPPQDSWGVSKGQYDFGDPPQWIKNRSAHELTRMKGPAPSQQSQSNVSDLLKNLSQFSQPQASQVQQQAFGASSDSSVQSLLAQLSNQQQPQAAPSPYDPQAAINLFMSMQGNNQPTAPPAPSMVPPPQPPAQPASNGTDLSSILSSLAAMNQQQQAPQPTPPQQQAPMVPQQQQQQQQQQPQPPPPPQQPQEPGVDADILAFLSKYNAQGAPSQPNQGQQGQNQPQWNQQAASLLGNWGQQGQQQDQLQVSAIGGQWGQQNQAQPGLTGNGADRKRGHDDDGTNGGNKKKKAFYGEPKVPCKYWKQGKCHYGDKCTFKHD